MKAQPQLPNQEELLVDYADRLRHHRKGRTAVHLRLSKLKPVNRKPHHLRLAEATFDPLIKRFEGQLFRLSNCDLVFVGKDMPRGELDDAVLKVRYMFREDPFIDQVEAATSEENFERHYDLDHDYSTFLSEMHRLRTICERLSRTPAVASSARPEESDPQNRAASHPLDAAALGRLEAALSNLDLTSVLRRQYVYAVMDDAPPYPVYCEYYVSIPAIQKHLMPDYDLRADPWLFQRLTTQLNQRVMQDLIDAGVTANMPAGINMHVANVLARNFLPFVTEVRRHSGKAVLVEMPVADLLEDTHAFTFARDFLRAHGQKICIDGMDPMIFRAVDRTVIQADLEKVEWSGEYKDQLLGDWREGFQKAVDAAGAAHVVLCQCDEAAAVEFGRSVGIRLFQGGYVDEMASSHEPAARSKAPAAI